MPAERFFVEGAHEIGDVVELLGGDARKVAVVLRKRSGDSIVLGDSTGRVFAASLAVEGQRVRARLDALVDAVPPPSLAITLAQGITKGHKMDFVVEKATEIGVARIVPFASERTVGEGDRGGKVERWRRLARSASQQCGRSEIPVVEPPLAWPALVARMREFDRALVPWEVAERVPLRERLGPLVEGAKSVLVVIGPEGGLSHAEVRAAEAQGAVPISLGDRILRTETAGLVACAALLYASGSL
ncbi:MAG: RsmE family RNA methyltransferase [Candidatus Baltobacteraceae bacterium]